MFWNRFIDLCSKKNTSPTAVICELGLSRGSVTNWKNGKMPQDVTLNKIANYFNVTIEYLKGEEDKKEKDSAEDGESLREFVVYHRDGKTHKVKFTPEQLKIFQALVDSANSQNIDK